MIAWLLRNCAAPPWAIHERSPYLRVAARLERERALAPEARRDRQWRGLRAIVAHAWENSLFYQRHFRAAGFEPGDLKSWDDLARLPVLRKQDVRDHTDELVARTYTRDELVRKRTSGSTGVSLHVLVDEPCTQFRRGVALCRDRWTGWDLGEYRAAVWGNPPPVLHVRQRLRYALLERTFYLDTLRMDEAMMEGFARQILVRRPTLLWGHAHSLYLFAQFWKKNGKSPPRLHGVLSTAMVLHAHERAGIEGIFGARVFDRYGCEEVSLIASECAAHEGLHVNTDALVVEINKRGTEPDGQVVVTDLRNRGMPFIRYEVGDRAQILEGNCPCGRTYPRLAKVMGRVADYLVTPNGELVSGISLTENFATLIPGVRQVQIIQDRITHLRMRVVPDADFDDSSRGAISALVTTRFGPAMTYTLDLVERIEQEASGKYRFAICRIPESELLTAALPTLPEQGH